MGISIFRSNLSFLFVLDEIDTFYGMKMSIVGVFSYLNSCGIASRFVHIMGTPGG